MLFSLLVWFVFLATFTNIIHQVAGAASLRAALQVTILATLYSQTEQLLPERVQKSRRLLSLGIYISTSLVNAFGGLNCPANSELPAAR